MECRQETKDSLVNELAALRERIVELDRANEALVQTNVSLRESEKMLRAVLRSSPEPMVVYDAEGRVRFLNSAFTSVFGWTSEELVGSRINYVPEEYLAQAWETIEKLFRGEPVPPFDTKRLTKDGRLLDVHISSAPFGDDKGKPAGHIVTLRDITKFRRLEEALRRESEQLLSIFDSINEIISVVDAETYEILYTNKYMQGLLGKDLVGGICYKEIHGRSEPCSHCAKGIAASLRGQPYRWDYHNPTTNKDYLATDRIIKWSDGRDAKFHLGIDVTAHKKAEKQLQESEKRFKELVDLLPQFVFEVNYEGYFTLANQAALGTMGCTLEDVSKGVHLRDVVAPGEADRAMRDFEKSLQGENVFGQEYLLRARDQRLLPIICYCSPIERDGKIVGLRGVAVDLTERKRAEEERDRLKSQLFQAQKLEAIGTLTGGIAHDFNNLLTIINGYTEMILMDKTEDDPLYGDLKKILETGMKGAEMVQMLLRFSKNAQISLQPLDLNLVVESSVTFMKRTFPKMVEIEKILERDIALVNADAEQVEQVLMNLCINAKEAMPDGGRLRIETRNTIVEDDHCTLQAGPRPGSYVIIEVSDTGAGMDKDIVDRVFDPFFTTKGWDFRKGTGLGLSVAKGIVEQHGGWITCQSQQGKGTAFTMYFPAIERLSEVEGSKPVTGIVESTQSILLVDDEEYVRDVGTRILERAGYTVITAANGREAVDIYAREQSAIALVILDLIMPQMGGEKCLEELLRINPRVKVIVSTGHLLDGRQRSQLGALAKGFVSKPYQVRQMVQAVKEVLALTDSQKSSV